MIAGVDLNFPTGTVYALLGPNGAGKTTTFGFPTRSFINVGRAQNVPPAPGPTVERYRALVRWVPRRQESSIVPPVVLAATVMQLLLGASFVVVGLNGAVFGPRARGAADAEVERQGLPSAVLADHGVDFGASRASVVVASCIGMILAVLSALDGAGVATARVLSWVVLPAVFVLGCVIMPSEVFLARGLRAVFAGSHDPAVRRIDATALSGAAIGALPGWVLVAIRARFVLATIGSPVIVVLLLLPAANEYFG